jgi:hypothetical protein
MLYLFCFLHFHYKITHSQVVQLSFNEKSVNKELVEDFNGLHCIYTNADSLPNKFDELKARVQNTTEKYDIIGVTEVYTKNCRYSPGKAELQLLGYELFCNESGEIYTLLPSLCFFFTHTLATLLSQGGPFTMYLKSPDSSSSLLLASWFLVYASSHFPLLSCLSFSVISCMMLKRES